MVREMRIAKYDTPFGTWCRRALPDSNPRSSVPMFVHNVDWLTHQFKIAGSRNRQAMLCLELKSNTNPALFSWSNEGQRLTLELAHQAMRSHDGDPLQPRRIKCIQKGMYGNIQVELFHFGYYLLILSKEAPSDDGCIIHWHSLAASRTWVLTQEQLVQVLSFRLNPDNPSFLLSLETMP